MSKNPFKPVAKPNFFILGAGKSGSTSLYYILKQHPEIHMSPIKEPVFFCEDFQVVKNPIQYFELFSPEKGEKLLGEASHAYLSNPSSPKVLKLLFPEAKFIVIMRNPVDRAYSLFNHQKRSGDELIKNFDKALKAEEGRFKSKKFRKCCTEYFYNQMYFRSGLYGEQIERYFSYFDKEQFQFLTLSQLKNDPLSTVKKIWKFLGADPDFTPEFKVRNKGKVTARFPLIQRIWNRKPGFPEFIRYRGMRILRVINGKKIPPMKKSTREMLTERYQKDWEKLYRLTGIKFQ